MCEYDTCVSSRMFVCVGADKVSNVVSSFVLLQTCRTTALQVRITLLRVISSLDAAIHLLICTISWQITAWQCHSSKFDTPVNEF